MKKVKFSELQLQVLNFLKNKKNISIIQIANEVYKDVPDFAKPKSPNNAITSSIIQINKKVPNLVTGRNYGWKGKFVTLNSDRFKTVLDQHTCKR